VAGAPPKRHLVEKTSWRGLAARALDPSLQVRGGRRGATRVRPRRESRWPRVAVEAG
jgi:hypothetical protein